MAEKKVPTQSEAIEQVNQISANNELNPNDKPDMVDPIVYRDDFKTEDIISGFDPKKLKNADVNINQYWDDSSAKNYNNSQLWWWENQKYTWENTKNSQVAYNKNATLEWLDPNYKYWQAAQMANSDEANYIARRNDEIASALYNAWKTSMEDVANFLNQQEWFRNSYENERQNTILSVWKRLGDIVSQNQQSNGEQAKGNNSPTDAVKDIESDLTKWNDWKIYGKVTADENTVIKTLDDENSVYKVMNEARIQNFKDMQSMSSEAIAASVVSWALATDTQTMRDLMQYDPAKYQEVQNQIKQLRGQMNINTITSWEWEWSTSASNGKSSLDNEKAEFISENTGMGTDTADLLKSINSSLDSNVSAATASEQMSNIENDMYTLQNRMKNLKREANQIFKWDVPQYIVNAYIANRTQEIQDQLSILENRYNAAYKRYQDEWERTKWDAEFSLKKEELQLKRESFELEDYATRQWIAIDWYKAKWESSTSINGNLVQLSTVSREEISSTVDSLIQGCQDGTLWNAQCAAWIQKYYLPYLWVDLGTLSKYSEKQGICNEEAGKYSPQKWDLVVMSSPTKPQNWHIWIVTGVEWDTLHYLDWNGSVKDWVGTETAAERTISLKSNRLYWYYNPTKTVNDDKAWWTYDWDKDLATDFYRMTPTEFAKLSNDARAEAYRLAWGETAFYTKKKAYNNEVVKKEGQKQWVDVLRSIAELYNMVEDDEGKLDFSWTYWPRSGSKDKFDQIKEKLKLEQLLEARANWATFGSMTEWEWKIIENAASSLKWWRTDGTISSEMEKVISAVYHATYWKKMTKKDWEAFKEDIVATNNWNNPSTTTSTDTKWTTKRDTNKTTQTQTGLSPEEKAKQLQWM